MDTVLQLRPGARRARVLRGHPWIFANEAAARLPDACNGQAIEARDPRGRSLGSGLYNNRSQIVWRRFSPTPRALDEATLRDLLQAAVARRADEPVRRLVWSEADDLPGLIVDQYHQTLVVQCQTLGMDQRRADLAAILRSLTGASALVWRHDAPARKLEGLELYAEVDPDGEAPPAWTEIDGLRYGLDFAHAQKTGFFLDQRPQHRAVAARAAGCRVLDACCHVGAFGLQAARAGAAAVTAVDISADSIQQVDTNADANGLAVEAIEANIFDFLRATPTGAYDLIVLDPPSFARNRAAVPGALRGYKELNLRALQMLPPGGFLATYSCSQHVSREAFMEVLTDAAQDAGRRVYVTALTGQPPDHPERLGIPESSYLKGAHLLIA